MGLYSNLPADLEISERSRKFYDGTYKWDSEGFTDSDGEHHQFDCSNPATQAPTPLPPMLLGDTEGEDTGGGFALEVTTSTTPSMKAAIASHGFDEETAAKHNGYLLNSRFEENNESPTRSTLHPDHGNHIGSSGLHDAGLARNGKAVEPAGKQPKIGGRAHEILNKREGEGGAKELTTVLSEHSSDLSECLAELSDCPSDLSDWDVVDKNREAQAGISSADSESEDDSTGNATWTPPKTTKRGGNKKSKAPAKTQPKNPKKATRKAAVSTKTGRAAKRVNGGK